MKFLWLLSSFIMFTACSFLSNDQGRKPASLNQLSWQGYFNEEIFAKNNLKEYFPNPESLQAWQISSDITYGATPPIPNELKEIKIQCPNKNLWPTHPQESTKEYIFGMFAKYNNSKLPANSYACSITNSSHQLCLMTTSAYLTVMSDLYLDECGNYYRAYWLVSFLKKDDNMGTYLSKGRTIFPDPHGQFSGEVVYGPTYSVASQEFLFLTPAVSSEINKVENEKNLALKQGYKMNGFSFLEPK